MAKTKEELNELKQEYETLTTKLKELTDEELKEVTGGWSPKIISPLLGNHAGVNVGQDELDVGNVDWKSGNDIPAEPGNYKIG